jgi:hypothetical protein
MQCRIQSFSLAESLMQQTISQCAECVEGAKVHNQATDRRQKSTTESTIAANEVVMVASRHREGFSLPVKDSWYFIRWRSYQARGDAIKGNTAGWIPQLFGGKR